MHNKLIEIRKAKKITQEQLSKKACMEQTTYSRKERGQSPITDSEWKILAEVLGVEVDDIKEDISALHNSYNNTTFNDNAVHIGVQYVNVPKDVLDSLLRYNMFLEEELKRLRQ
jgi:transcriptional regulator with XRE-family HTH domain